MFGHKPEGEPDYFEAVARRLGEGLGGENLKDVSGKLVGAHTHHIAGKTGLVQTLDPETLIDIIPFVDPITDKWQAEHPKQALDILDDKQGGNIQTLFEAVGAQIRRIELGD